MKHNKHIFPFYFLSYINETKSVRLINLSSKENCYAFNLDCKILFKSKQKIKSIQSPKIKNIILSSNFIKQYF